MNKMNLPSPFEESFLLQENDIFNSFIIYILENYISENDLEKKSSSEEESELESENEESSKTNSSLPKKRLLPTKKLLKKRKLLEPKITVIPKTNKPHIEDVFEKIERENLTKKIEVILKFMESVF